MRKHQTDVKRKQLENDLRDCMKCKFFWGNAKRCIHSTCVKEEKRQKPKENECTNCPYKQSSGYCFPCMKKLLGHKKMETQNNSDFSTEEKADG